MIEQDVSARLNPALIELQREVLQSGHPLRIKLFGMSMYPWIRPGDVCVIRSIRWTDLRRGDVVFYERESRLVAHRVLVPPVDEESPLIAKGDTLENFDPPVRPEQLMGRVEALERGTRTLSLVNRRGALIQRGAAEISGPYSKLFWKVAAWRRRMIKSMLAAPAYRKRRRAAALQAQPRKYLFQDLDHLANCLWDLQPNLNFAQMRDWTGLQIELLGQEGASVWVMEESRRLVGFGWLTPIDAEGAIWLSDWYLHPLMRGYGLGEQLLDALETEAAALGAKEISASVPSSARAAQKLLKKRGWIQSRSAESNPPEGLFLKNSGDSFVWTHTLSSAVPLEEATETAAK